MLHMHCQWLERFDAAVIEQRINSADLVLGVSNFIAAGVRRRFPSLAQRCSHLYNGTDIALFARPPGVRPKPKQLLYVGRLAPEKGVHILLDAFRIVLTHHPDAHLELIGPENVWALEAMFPGCADPHLLELGPYFRPGAYAQLLRAKVSEFPSGSISFLNKGVKFIDLAPHYHSASIFAFPSICEELLRHASGRSDGVWHACCGNTRRCLLGNRRRRPKRLPCRTLRCAGSGLRNPTIIVEPGSA